MTTVFVMVVVVEGVDYDGGCGVAVLVGGGCVSSMGDVVNGGNGYGDIIGGSGGVQDDWVVVVVEVLSVQVGCARSIGDGVGAGDGDGAVGSGSGCGGSGINSCNGGGGAGGVSAIDIQLSLTHCHSSIISLLLMLL